MHNTVYVLMLSRADQKLTRGLFTGKRMSVQRHSILMKVYL